MELIKEIKGSAVKLAIAIYYFLLLAAMIAFGSVLVHTGKQIDSLTSQGTAYVKQLGQDWDRKFYTDVEVVSTWDCPEGTNELYESIWYGHKHGCDCIGVCGEYMNGCNKLHSGSSCTQNQTMYGCIRFGAFPPIRQAQFEGKRICGRNDGETFLTVQRPNSNNECPKNYAPCSDQTNAESTICYDTRKQDQASLCPITDIKFVEKAHVATLGASYKSVEFNSTVDIVFSKNAPNLPITTTKVEHKPCMDSLYGSTSPKRQFYPAEIGQKGCIMEKNNMLTYDPRYSSTGLHTNDGEVMRDSNVLDRLTSLPHYHRFGDYFDALSNQPIQGWNRPTLGWSISCEESGKTRQEGYDASQTDLETIERNARQFKACGWSIIALFLLACLGPLAKEAGLAAGFCVIQITFIVCAPLVAVRMSQEGEQNRANVAKLDNFKVLNDCADEYTNVNITQIDDELDQAHYYVQVIKVWLWFTFTMFLFQPILISFLFCKDKCSKEDDQFAKVVENSSCDSSNEDPEAKFIREHEMAEAEAEALAQAQAQQQSNNIQEASLPLISAPVYDNTTGNPGYYQGAPGGTELKLQ